MYNGVIIIFHEVIILIKIICAKERNILYILFMYAASTPIITAQDKTNDAARVIITPILSESTIRTTLRAMREGLCVS